VAKSATRKKNSELPQWITSQLTELVGAAPEGDQWLHEIKFDGYRMHARLDRGAVRLLTRTGLDWTHKYPVIAMCVSSLKARQAYLDANCAGPAPTASPRSARPRLPPISAAPSRSSSICSTSCISTARTSA
jgi:bifunctional non-homologous end joining protein LigD